MLCSGLPSLVGNDEDLIRFVYQRSDLSANGIKFNAFMPAPKLELSVTRCNRAQLNEIQSIEATNGRLDKTLHGAGAVKADLVRAIGLDAVASEPPAKHANIIGWPPEKEKQKLLALKLANGCTGLGVSQRIP